MTPTDKFSRAQGETEALSEGLRQALSGSSPKLPKLPQHKTGRETRSWSHRGLTLKQKTILGRLASAAHAAQLRYGLADPDLSADAWRRAEAISVVGCRISEALQAHYLPLKGHFEALAGKTDLPTFNNLTAAPDSGDRASIVQALREELARFAQLPGDDGRPVGELAAEAYLFAIAKHRGNLNPRTVATIVETWSPTKIETLVITLRNRINAKLGIGDSWNRNKSQRRARK